MSGMWQKITSRRFWVALGGVAVSIGVVSGRLSPVAAEATQEAIVRLAELIVGGTGLIGSIIGYLTTEASVDRARIANGKG